MDGQRGMLAEKDIPVKKIAGTKYARLLTYPRMNEPDVKERIDELLSIGVTSLHFEGGSFIDGIPILGKGCVGIVTEAVLNDTRIALKIRRADADRPTMKNEARMLRVANSVGVGPRLIAGTRNLLAIELFEGVPLFKWADGIKDRKRVKPLLRDLLESCFKLDSVGLDHGELSHAPKNVLVNRRGRGCIVDFETASTVRRPANVTSLIQYFLFGRVSKEIHASRLFPQKRMILRMLSAYKQDQSLSNFQNILTALDVA